MIISYLVVELLSKIRLRAVVVAPEGISMSTAKVESVKNWPVPRNVKDVQAFLGFANFYWHFIEGFRKICKPRTDLTQKDKMFEWTSHLNRRQHCWAEFL